MWDLKWHTVSERLRMSLSLHWQCLHHHIVRSSLIWKAIPSQGPCEHFSLPADLAWFRALYNTAAYSGPVLLKSFPRENVNNNSPSSQGPKEKPSHYCTKVHSGEPMSLLDFLIEGRWNVLYRDVGIPLPTHCTWKALPRRDKGSL